MNVYEVMIKELACVQAWALGQAETMPALAQAIMAMESREYFGLLAALGLVFLLGLALAIGAWVDGDAPGVLIAIGLGLCLVVSIGMLYATHDHWKKQRNPQVYVTKYLGERLLQDTVVQGTLKTCP